MPFRDAEPAFGPIGLAPGFDLNPEEEVSDKGLLGAAFRQENPIVSAANSYTYDRREKYDLSYRPWDDIQGTVYEGYADRFLEARNRQQVQSMKAQIDREMEDRKVIDAAGGWGFLASMGAAVLSPTSLMPGGALVRGAKGGISIGRTAMNTAGWAAAATAIDEIGLHATQATRTGAESAYAIGGSVLLGSLLGSAAGTLSRRAFLSTSTVLESLPSQIGDLNNSLSAADPRMDMSLRREKVFAALDAIPGVRALVRSDPILRTQLSDYSEVRRTTAGLVETPLQYAANETGQTMGPSVESIIKTRKNTELSQSLAFLGRSFSEYVYDGPVGTVGRITAPVTARWQHLMDKTGKMTRQEFMEEVGKAAIMGDTHPIPQVAKAAEEIRKTIFDRALKDAIDVGLFEDVPDLKNGESYFMRSYNIEKIIQHLGDGSADDLKVLLRDEYMRNRSAAAKRLENDRTVENIQAELSRQKEAISQQQAGIKKAYEKARGKRDRAENAIKRDRAVARAVDGLRKRFEKRKRDLYQSTAKGYVPPETTAWRSTQVSVDRPYAPTFTGNAGDYLDDIQARQKTARALLDCVATRDAKHCLKAFPLAGVDKDRWKAAMDEFKDSDLAAEIVARDLETDISALQEALANQGVLVDLDGEMPSLNLYQDIQASIRVARSALNNRPMDILQAVRGAGGFKVNSDGGELVNIFDTSAHTLKRKDGLEPDHMREVLEEAGYLPAGSDINEMWDTLRAAKDGEEVFSRQEFGQEIEAYLAAKEFAAELEGNGLNIRDVTADDIIGLETNIARNAETTKAKAQEAGRSAKEAGKVETSSVDRFQSALDKLAEADWRLLELDEIVEPRVRDEIKTARKEVSRLQPLLKKAKKARSADDFYANKSDLEVEADVDDTINSIIGLKPGEHSYRATMSSPTHARVLDVETEKLAPWLDTDMGKVMAQYFESIVPDIEIVRRFGDINLTEAKRKIVDEKDRMIRGATTAKERTRVTNEARDRLTDIDGMRDRLRGTYGVPSNPRSIWVRGGRVARTLSYTGYLGGMMLSALPDVAGVVGRNGIEAAFGPVDAVTNPRRMGLAVKDAAELGASAEWYLNSRAASIADVMDPYGEGSRFERGAAATGRAFGVATGMVPWNVGWKAIGGAYVGSKISKAAVAVAEGKATKAQVLKLAENYIDQSMALRIAAQVEKHADRNGLLWLPQAAKWDDMDAFNAMKIAMNREMDLQIITPGQDKPLAFSSEAGKFFSQFKSFTFSAHHRILLSGIQRADATVLAQVTTAVLLGGLVSNIKAWMGGYEPKEGTAFWEDAIDRSGLAGWMMEAHGLANGFTGGALSISGEEVSRFQSRSSIQGLLGPSVDMVAGLYEGVSAAARGEMSSRDARKVLRPLPGNNLPYFIGLTNQVAEAMAEMR